MSQILAHYYVRNKLTHKLISKRVLSPISLSLQPPADLVKALCIESEISKLSAVFAEFQQHDDNQTGLPRYMPFYRFIQSKFPSFKWQVRNELGKKTLILDKPYINQSRPSLLNLLLCAVNDNTATTPALKVRYPSTSVLPDDLVVDLERAFEALSFTQSAAHFIARFAETLVKGLAGETITLVARHLRDLGVKRIVVANRTLERANILAEEFGAHAVLLSDIPAELVNSDIVISSTASQLPILGKGAVESALKLRKHKPIFMVDIAVPRDIEPEVGELDDVYLYSVDDLHEVVAENLKSRQGAAQAAEELVSVGAEDFMLRLRELAAVDVLKAYRNQGERLRDEELLKAQRMLANGSNAEDVLIQLARGLTNKLLHAPSVQLKKLSAEGRLDALAMAQELFALGEGSTDKPPQ